MSLAAALGHREALEALGSSDSEHVETPWTS